MQKAKESQQYIEEEQSWNGKLLPPNIKSYCKAIVMESIRCCHTYRKIDQWTEQGPETDTHI